MDWLEVSVETDREMAEAVSEVLSRYAPQGVAIDLGDDPQSERVIVRAYLADDGSLDSRKRQIEEALWHLGQIRPLPAPAFRLIADRDWTEGWKESIPILHIGAHIVIKPSWREYEAQPGEVVLELDPGLAFGTGLHPTTRLCLEALETHVADGMRVLDLGSGTGILALAAAKLAQVEVLAVDNDQNAVVATRRNARRNGVSARVRPLHGSLENVSGTYDLILANLLAPVLIRMAQDRGLATRLKPRGVLIASGVLAEQEDEVADAFEANGLAIVERRREEDWVAIIARRK